MISTFTEFGMKKVLGKNLIVASVLLDLWCKIIRNDLFLGYKLDCYKTER